MLFRLRYELSKCEVNGSVVVSHLITRRYYNIRVSESGVNGPRSQSKKYPFFPQGAVKTG